jgi:hypothetical protein
VDDAKESLGEGSIFGLLTAGTAYTIVQVMGYNPGSLAVLLYFQLFSAILLTMRSKMAAPLMPFLKRIVVVAEGEEMKLKRVLTGEEYRVRDVEKV